MTTGANEDGFHLQNVSIERDIKVTAWFDLRTVTAGEPCAKCGKPLKIRRAIEVGHVFKLGTKYSEALNATFLDETGARKPSIMGCYGIGVTRTLQAVIEQGNDKDGIIWPLSVAPYQVCITPLAVAPESEAMKLAEKIYAELTAKGVDVILDDRDERPGVKFKDSELVGFPIRIGIGEKSLVKGEVEIKPRNGAMQSVKIESAVETVMKFFRRTVKLHLPARRLVRAAICPDEKSESRAKTGATRSVCARVNFKRKPADQSFCNKISAIFFVPAARFVRAQSGCSPISRSNFNSKAKMICAAGFFLQRQSRNPRNNSKTAGSGVSVSVACSMNAVA